MLGLEKHTQHHHNSQCGLRNSEYNETNTIAINTLGNDSTDYFESFPNTEDHTREEKKNIVAMT